MTEDAASFAGGGVFRHEAVVAPVARLTVKTLIRELVGADMAVFAIIIPILYVLAGAGVLYAIIRFAIVHALRQSRNEARIEQRVPKAATWLDDDERRLLDMSNASHD